MRPWLRLTLILMTVGGGFAGFAVTLQSLLNSLSAPPLNLFLTLLFAGLYAFVVASGLWFTHDPKRTDLLLAALAIQIPSISYSSFVYLFSAGLVWIISISGPEKDNTVGVHVGWEMYFGGSWKVSIRDGNPLRIGVNLVALTLFLLLWKAGQPSAPPAPDSQGVYDPSS